MGELISGQTLLDLLRDSERIFKKESWSESQLIGSGYDLRLAGDLLVIPPSPGAPGHIRFELGHHKRSFILAPGDSAVVSTMEECTFDFDISALIGPKFGMASKGLLVLQGMAAHPGYGRELLDDEWLPKQNGERLYFIVVNVGPDYVPLQEGQSIAFLQIFHVEPPVRRELVKNVGFDSLSGLFRTGNGAADGGLRYFRMVRDVQEKVDAIEVKVNYAENAVDRVSNASNMIVVFGVFLVSTTVLGFALSMLVSLIEKFSFNMGSARGVISVSIMTLYGLATVASVLLVNSAVRRAVGRKDARDQPKRRMPG